MQIICKISLQNLRYPFPYIRGFPKRSKQRFSLLREKAAGSVPEDLGSQYKSPILGPKKGFWVFRKSPKILTASDQYFLSYVKKNKLPGMG